MTTKKIEQPAAAPASAPTDGFSLISHQTLRQLYANMVKCRKGTDLAPMQSTASALALANATGQEAVTVGVTFDLLPEDAIAGLNGDLATTIGAALAHKTRKNGKIAVVFRNSDCAPAGSGSITWEEALQIANAHELPILFVCQHGMRAESASLQAATGAKARRGTPAPPAQPYGFPSIPVDGEDVVAVYRVASESIARARQDRGATLIECHKWITGDPILNMEQYLLRKGLFTREFQESLAGKLGATFEVTASPAHAGNGQDA